VSSTVFLEETMVQRRRPTDRVRPRAILLWAVLVATLAGTGPVGAQTSPASRTPAPTTEATPLPSPPTAAFAAAPGDAFAPTGLSWVAATVPSTEAWPLLDELTTWAGGFVALERTSNDEILAAVWRSADGSAWERSPVRAPMRGMASLVVDGTQLVLGVRGLYDRSGPVELWRSDDAVEWTRAGRLMPQVPADLRPPWRHFIGPLVTIDGRLVQYTILSDETGSGGWAPIGPRLAMVGAQALLASGTPDRNIAWLSRDGRRWTARQLTGASTGTAFLDVITPTDDGLLALRLGDGAALLRSADGVRWRQVAPLPDAYSWGGSQGLVPVEQSVLLFADDSGPGTGHGNHLGAWRLEPDGSWTRILDAQAAFTNDQAAAEGWLIVVGRSWTSVHDWAWTLVSRDGGRTWDSDLGWIGAAGSCAGDVAIRDETVVMLGCDPAQAPVWTATLAVVGGSEPVASPAASGGP
jgi:hypothetical protein